MAEKIILTKEEATLLTNVLETAKEQLEKIGKVIPEGMDAIKKHPGINPVGYYSEIDMGFAERMKRCDNAVRTKDILAWTEYTDLKKRIETNPAYEQMKKDMVETSKNLRTIDRALRLCKDDNVRKALEEKREELNNTPVLKEYDTLMEILEFHSGAKFISREIEFAKVDNYEFDLTKFCHDKFGINMGGDAQYDPYKQVNRFSNPKNFEIEFENLDDIMQCQRMVTDENMGKSWDEVEKAPLEDNEFRNYASVVPAYMQASCDRVLDSALPDVKDRADYILINGVSIREQMKTQEGIENPSEEQIKKYSSLYVAAALRQGMYVETFIKDYTHDGNFINYKPVPIVAKGEDSTILKKDGDNELENITIGFIDRVLAKLGFTRFKEKIEKANALEKIKQGREAFRDAHTVKNNEDEKRLSGQTMKKPLTKEKAAEKKEVFNALIKNKDTFLTYREELMSFSVHGKLLQNQFFPQGLEKVKILNKDSGMSISDTREKLVTFAVVKMLKNHYSLEDILDLSKNADEKKKMAQDVCKELTDCSEKEFFERHMEVTGILSEHLEKYAKDHNISFSNPSSVYKNSILLGLMSGAGNVPDIFMQRENKAKVEGYFGKGIVEKVEKETDAFIINGDVKRNLGNRIRLYQEFADGVKPTKQNFLLAIREAVYNGVFSTMEQETGKVYSHPITFADVLQIENALIVHPNVEKFYNETPADKLIDSIVQGNLLKDMNVEFKALSNEQTLGIDFKSETFDIDVPCNGTPMKYVPTFDGSIEYYEIQGPEMDNGMER